MGSTRLIEILRDRKRKVVQALPAESLKKIFYDKGMLPPRVRIEKLLDPGTFVELDQLATHQCRDFGMDGKFIPADGVITGFGFINGKKVAVYAQDFSALGGTYGEMHGKKICALMDMAVQVKAPIIGICHSGGLRLHETLGPMEMFGQLFKRNSQYSGVVPQITLVLGAVAGGQAYSPGLTDFIFMSRNSSIFIAGPAFVKAQTGQVITEDELGGPNVHGRESGVADWIGDTEEDVLNATRWLVGLLPRHWEDKDMGQPGTDPVDRVEETLETIVPERVTQGYDMKKILTLVFDDKYIFELKSEFAKNMITAFGKLNGQTVGIVANQPSYLGGVIDIKASEKAARFVRFCDAFGIPVITFQDSPAYLIGKAMEEGGIICKGAKLLHAYAEATVPKVTVIVRKAYAGAYIAMGSQYLGADLVYAWPCAEIASVGAKTAASILFRKEIATAKGPEEIEALCDDYQERFVNPYRAASLRHINDIIEPSKTRETIIRALTFLKDKEEVRPRRKHGNIPL